MVERRRKEERPKDRSLNQIVYIGHPKELSKGTTRGINGECITLAILPLWLPTNEGKGMTHNMYMQLVL